MKICLCSDSHGNPEGIVRMLQQEQPDGLLFLGDGMRDFLKVDLPDGMYFAAVAGNCDMACQEPPYRTITLLGRKLYLCHGHREQVKQGLSGLSKAAAEAGAHVALYGHTHLADAKVVDGILCLNPGSMQDRSCRYALLWEEAGELRYSLKMVKF